MLVLDVPLELIDSMVITSFPEVSILKVVVLDVVVPLVFSVSVFFCRAGSFETYYFP